MSEVPLEIKNTVDKLNKQLNEHYEKILHEHKQNISTKLNENNYISEYGKITHIEMELNKTILFNTLTKEKEKKKTEKEKEYIQGKISKLKCKPMKWCPKNQLKLLPSEDTTITLPNIQNKYFIHICCERKYFKRRDKNDMYVDDQDDTYYVIDNYGISHEITQKNNSYHNPGGGHFFRARNVGTYDGLKINKKINSAQPLPNILVDVIKSLSYIEYQGHDNRFVPEHILSLSHFLDNVCTLSQHYYENFTKYSSLYDSGKLIEYNDAIIQQKNQKEINQQLNDTIKEKDEHIKMLKDEISKTRQIMINDVEKKQLKTQLYDMQTELDDVKIQSHEQKKLHNNTININCSLNDIIEKYCKNVDDLMLKNKELENVNKIYRNLLTLKP